MRLKDDLFIGIHVLPGVAQGIAVRPTGANVSHSERYVRAFLLPAVPALKEAASLVLPRGWYQPERVVEDLLSRMTLDEKIGQCLTLEFCGTILHPHVADYVRQFTIRVPENLARLDRVERFISEEVPDAPAIVREILAAPVRTLLYCELVGMRPAVRRSTLRVSPGRSRLGAQGMRF